MRGLHSCRLHVLAVALLAIAATSTVADAQNFSAPNSRAIVLPAVTFTNLASFDGTTDGKYPIAPLIQGRDGNYYGTTSAGGVKGGTIFRITPEGKLATIYSFCPKGNCADGGSPYGGLVLATDGNYYGTTFLGGEHGEGTVFRITAAGKLTTLYSFCPQSGCPDGRNPAAGLVQGTDGNFYGTTQFGGTGAHVRAGTIFKITPKGTLTTLYSFCNPANCTDGAQPEAALIQATNGNFYGTTDTGGKYFSPGTVFEITPAGKFTTIYSFQDAGDGNHPLAALVQATDGNFYGTTELGGANNYGVVFKLTPGGKLTTLHSFDSTDGARPFAGLIQASDGNFYGTTYYGGANTCSGPGCGTVFEITPRGTLTSLYSFCTQTNCPDGYQPAAAPMQATAGSFYGTTQYGGANGLGTVFSLSASLGSFVAFVRGSGKVGSTVEILGQGFTGTTAVSFNGTAASFTVVSDTYLTAMVPNGATTGKVEVTTPDGTLKSNLPFRVTPQILSFTPTSGTVGTSVTIMGMSLSQASKVTFGGVKATSFTVNADNQVTATVPTGAKTGRIAITTPGGIAVSQGVFTVTQGSL